MKLSKDVEPKGTRHVMPKLVGKTLFRPVYRVAAVWGAETHLPTGTDPLVCLVLDWDEWPPVSFENYITLPLSVFVKDAEPLTKKDIFWQ